MTNVDFRLNDEGNALRVSFTNLSTPHPDRGDIKRFFSVSDYKNWLLIENNIDVVLDELGDTHGDDDQIDVGEVLSALPIAQKRDAAVSLDLSDDKMSAKATLITAHGGENFGVEGITEKLIAEGVVKGLDDDVLHRLCNKAQFAPAGEAFKEVVARGKSAEPGIPSSFEYHVIPLQDRVLAPNKREDGTRDMHDLGEIPSVKPGDKLMSLIPAHAGEAGYNVLGEVLESVVPTDVPFEVGEGTAVSDTDPNLLVATMAGVLMKIRNGVSVSEALMVKDVDLTVGNVEYDGNVMVKGNIKEGMLVKASGDVIVDGIIESATIISGGDVTIKLGIIGQASEEIEFEEDLSAKIIAEGTITARYAQYAFIQAKKDVQMAGQILHCIVRAGGDVAAGGPTQRQGKLVGGIVKGSRSITAGILGSPANSKTKIDFSEIFTEHELTIQKLSQEIEVKRQLFLDLYDSLTKKKKKSGKKMKVTDQMVKIRNTIMTLKDEVNEMSAQVDKARKEMLHARKKLTVDVHTRLYPGVECIIYGDHYPVTAERGRCTIKFDDTNIIFA
jgi:hypothetical protein|tara:strand:+ start:384 stop:2054 length:1671 start_codon:yes stop_codon:yes gene_type:complete